VQLRAGRRTNLALLVLLALALTTGAAAYAAGSASGGLVVVGHGVAGLAVAVLAPWKSVVVRRGLRRVRPDRPAAVALALVVIVTLVAGVLHSVFGLTGGPVTAMQLHVGAALLVLPLVAGHVLARPQRPRPTDLSRRRLLRLGLVGAGGAAAWAGVEGAAAALGVAGADRRFTGSHERFPVPVTQWLSDDVPRLDPASWALTVEGRRWSYEQLRGFDDRVVATLDCTGGWYATRRWSGVRVDRLLPTGARGRSLRVVSVTGYARRLPFDAAARLLLATGLDGAPLTPGHGFPVRLVAPGRRGFWWVKWVVRVEVSERPWWLQSPFPLQ
jgi:hypothetical protein